ncbi:MAG: cold shock domain-containing protein [Chloroflexota bacterium]|nr:cold shock domain-containing protein [Chloroflexota bacterium]
MATGTVKTVPNVKNYAFIIRDGETVVENREIFFHRTSVADDGFDSLRDGQRVNYEEERDPRDSSRRRAVRVTPVRSS